jgi:hypothetical protein
MLWTWGWTKGATGPLRIGQSSSKDPMHWSPHQSNALRFEFAAPFYEEPSSMEYQVRLEGSDPEWLA